MSLGLAVLALFFSAELLFSGTVLIKSTDGGRTWTDVDPGPRHRGVVDLQIAADGSHLYALTVTQIRVTQFGGERRDYAVLSSTDGGRTWLELYPLEVDGVWSATMAVAPSNPETVYVAYVDTNLESNFQFGMFSWSLRKTTDGGRTAADLRGNEEVLSPVKRYPTLGIWTGPLIAHPGIPTTIFLGLYWVVDFDGVYSGFLASMDGGSTWQLSGNVGLAQVSGSPGDPSTLYAKHQETYARFTPHLVKSTDGGNEWSLKLSDVPSFALNPGDPAALVASRNDGSLWKSTDRAESWQHLGNWLPFDRLKVHPGEPSLLLAQAPALVHQGVNTGDVYRSLDGGATWNVLPTGMDGFSFVFDPSDPNTIYGISARRLEPRLRPPYIRNLAGGSTLGPGSLFSVYGEDLAGRVTFNGQPADLFFVSPRQINGRVPAGLNRGEVLVEVARETVEGLTLTDPQSITLSTVATPVILHDPSGQAELYHLSSGRRITRTDPAAPGEQIVAYCAGLGGPETQFVQFWPVVHQSTAQPFLFAEPAADRPGVHRAGIEVPRTLGPGSYPVLLWAGRNFARLEVS